MANTVSVIGAGLAGCEAAYQLAKRGVEVFLYDIKPNSFTPAHASRNFAEIVCSNSLKSTDLTTASGLLKKELETLDSLILKTAYKNSVPAGNALAVDRDSFSKEVTDVINKFKNIHFVSKEISSLPEGVVIVATGPLTTQPLAQSLATMLNSDNLYFYDASSPIVECKSIDMTKAYVKDRYDKGSGDYINCPLDREEYEEFYKQLVGAECVQLRNFEKKEIFEGCMPIEIMAKRGEKTLRFGPLKPVGLEDPQNGKRPYAVVQLRKEDNHDNLYNLVGFQTNLTFGEQKRVFSLIPALNHANFVKYGVMHRNTFVNAPQVLSPTFQTRQNPNVFIAGQLSGVEGYMESTMSGLICGINAYLLISGKPLVCLSSNTMTGAIINYITSFPGKNFQPMNANFGIVSPLDTKEKDDKVKKQKLVDRALKEIKNLTVD